MNIELHRTTQEMITDYYAKSSRYSKSILILAMVGVTGVLVSAGWIYQTRIEIQRQQKEIIKVQQAIDIRVQEVQDKIDCVGQYFTQTDRANIKIKSLEDCSIQRIR